MTHSQVRYILLPLVAVLVIGCSDGKARRRVSAMDTETLERLRTEYPADSKSGRLIAEELARRPRDTVREPESIFPNRRADRAFAAAAERARGEEGVGKGGNLRNDNHRLHVACCPRRQAPYRTSVAYAAIEVSVQQVWFYDKKSKTPTGVPMTDDQMLHWRAKYSINRNTGHEEFVFITITDPSTSPPEISETKATIRPGYAD